MQTAFSLAQLADPKTADAEKILRTCVHCGFCTATCPTYVLLGDERDSPRGRIYMMKDMFEGGKPASEEVVTHVDRCLTCLSCMSTCPSGVHYMHLVDQARVHIEETYKRPFMDRALRSLLAFLLPKPGLFRVALVGAWFARPFKNLVPPGLLKGRARAMLSLAPKTIPSPSSMDRIGVFPANENLREDGRPRKRVAMLAGCAQRVLAPQINESTIRLLNRHGVDVVIAQGAGCCGALTHHMGREDAAHTSAKANIDAWIAEMDGEGLDAIVINASGCGTTVKDYGHMFRLDPEMVEKAKIVSGLTRDITEVMLDLGLKLDEEGAADGDKPTDLTVAYHSACSMQHGQKLKTQPKKLLQEAGFTVREPMDSHLCCGSAGTYNLLQPEIAVRLRDRKVGTLEKITPDVIATGNIGCMTQIATGTGIPVVHSVELLDWATGGPKPEALGQ
ncbi:MAG: glycolate oxidase subunit GlcF [Pseudomonadota bacterium]